MIVIGDKSVHSTAWEILDSSKLGSFPAFWDGPTLFSYCRGSYDWGLPRTFHAHASTPSIVIRAGRKFGHSGEYLEGRRGRTRAEDRAGRINDERRPNAAELQDNSNADPPPF
jgi:hypothetical protein